MLCFAKSEHCPFNKCLLPASPGELFLKIEEEDDQGWCRGMKEGGVEGFYPANYVQLIDWPPAH